MQDPPNQGDNGERQPDPEQGSGGTADDRAHAGRLEGHSSPATAPTEHESTRPDRDA